MKQRDLTLDDYAAMSETTGSRLGRVLRGEIPMRMTDIGFATRHFGLNVHLDPAAPPEPDYTKDPEPPPPRPPKPRRPQQVLSNEEDR